MHIIAALAMPCAPVHGLLYCISWQLPVLHESCGHMSVLGQGPECEEMYICGFNKRRSEDMPAPYGRLH
jgi:hypothetical protein